MVLKNFRAEDFGAASAAPTKTAQKPAPAPEKKEPEVSVGDAPTVESKVAVDEPATELRPRRAVSDAG